MLQRSLNQGACVRIIHVVESASTPLPMTGNGAVRLQVCMEKCLCAIFSARQSRATFGAKTALVVTEGRANREMIAPHAHPPVNGIFIVRSWISGGTPRTARRTVRQPVCRRERIELDNLESYRTNLKRGHEPDSPSIYKNIVS